MDTAISMDINAYKIIRELGKGGMATVYLAIQESFEREVALKVMSLSLSADPSFGERFIREAKIVSRLVHPNIVTVYDVGVSNGYHFLSMEYVPGRDLRALRAKMSLRDVIGVIKDVALALDFANRKGCVHRDVKPENIMLHDEGGRAVLMDFGIAKSTDVSSGMTQVGSTIGTPHYMSPEQARGKAVDGRSDIYSLGVVFYWLLLGHVPFSADSAIAVGIKHLSAPIPVLPQALMLFQDLIDKAMAKKPEQRFQSGRELAEALDRLNRFEIDAAEANRAPPVEASGELHNADEAPTAVHESVGEHARPSPSAARPLVPQPAPKVKRVRARPDAMSVTADDRVGAHIPQAPKAQRSSRWMMLLALLLGTSAYIYSDAKAQTIVLSHWINVQVQIERHLGIDLSRSAELLNEYFPSLKLQSYGEQALPRKPDVSPVSELPQKPIPKPLVLDSPLSEANALLPKLDEDIGVAKDIAAAYQSLLVLNPGHEQALAGIESLKLYHIQKLELALEQGQLTIAEALVDSALANLPEINLSVRMQILQKQLLLMKLGQSIELAQLDEADALLREAQSRFPDSEELRALSLRYDNAVSANKGATSPKK